MQVTETLSDGLKRSYAVTVPAADLESRAKVKLAGLGKELRLPGFRPGKVPANLVRQRYGSAVMAEVMQEALNTAADDLIGEKSLRPAGQPRISLIGEPKVDAAKIEDLQFKVELELLPEITPPDLSTISLTRCKSIPAEDAIAKALEQIATQNRALEDITEDRGAATGEILVVDFTGSIDGTPFQGGTGGDINIEVGGQGFIPGFTEQLEGLKPGETRTIDVTFPAAYHAAELAGKPAKFEIVAKALKRGVTPAVDDALATKLGFESLDKLREAITSQMQREFDQLSRLKLKRELLDVLAERADFQSPENLLDTEFNAIWQRVEADRREGRVDEEDAGKSDETLRAEYRAIADRRVRLGLLLSEIGTKASIQVTQPELTAALRAEAGRYPGQEMQVIEFFQKNPGAIEQLRGPIFEDKVVDHILTLVQLDEKEVPPEELAMPPASEAGILPAASAPAESPAAAAPAAEAAPEATEAA